MIWSEIRYSARSLGRSPALTSTLLLTIALGIGSNAVVAAFVRGFSNGQNVSGALSHISALLWAGAWTVSAIACVNVATLLLSRSSSRLRESSVRTALGATRAQIARQLAIDAVLLSVAGAVLGVVLASWTAHILPSFLFDQDAEQLSFVADVRATTAAAALCAAVMVICGLAPLIQARQDNSATVLRRESAGPSPIVRRLRTSLVLVQMTCCSLLVIAAAILITGFRNTLRTHSGGLLKQAILATVESEARFTRPDLGLNYFDRIERAAQSAPSTIATAWSSVPPGSRAGSQSVRIERTNAGLREVVLDVALFTPKSLHDVRLPPIAGRMFGVLDTPQSCPVVVINAAARDVIGHEPVGEMLINAGGQRAEIVGLVASSETASHIRQRPTVYYYPDQQLVSDGQLGETHFRVVTDRPETATIATHVVSTTYADVMGLTVVEATTFRKVGAGSCRSGMLNQEASDAFFSGHAVGGALIDTAGTRTEIVGVVQPPSLRVSLRREEPAIYLPMTQDYVPEMTLVIASQDASAATLASIRKQLDAVPGGRKPANVRTLEQHLTRVALAPERIATILIGASAAIGLALGTLGLYGAMNDAARRRRREFGVRIALGSQAWRVIAEVLREGLRLAAAGMLAALLLSRLVTRWLSEVTASSEQPPSWIFVAAPATLLAIVLIASVLPARLALATDPLTIMRDE